MHALKKISYFYTGEYMFPEVNAVMASEKLLSLPEHTSIRISVILIVFMLYIITSYKRGELRC